jgi:DNA-3-methyladenine glycosylase I
LKKLAPNHLIRRKFFYPREACFDYNDVTMLSPKTIQRCEWSGTDPLYVQYHDEEWGVPLHDEQKLFEFLVLEGMQAGLSWITILRKRENFRKAFDNFDAKKIARYQERKIVSLLQDAGIIRNRQKILATIANARAFLKVQDEFGTFDEYIWRFVDGKPVVNRWKTLKEIPAKTTLSETISKDLIQRGFRFVGPTIVYAHLQATGVVQDHLVSCFRYKELVRAK